MSAVATNTIRSRLATSSSLLAKRASPSQRSLARFAHTNSTPAAQESSSLMMPAFLGVGVVVSAGLLYTLSRSSGRIGSRFAAREKSLDRTKFLHEGDKVDDKWLH
ncbi:hypothetical protein DV735_g1836, partial [Chaetothyriales sp. CBS 134920]